MKSIQKCDCNYLARFAVSDSFIRDNSFRGLLAIFMVTIFVPGTAFSELYVNNANDPGCYAVVDDNNLNFKGRITGIVTNHIYCNTLTEANLNTNGGQLFVGGQGGLPGYAPTPWTGTFTTAVGTSNVATAYGFVVQKNGAFINGDTYVQGGLFLNGRKATNLAPATVSSTSTDAVVGSQLYTVIQDGTRYFHANSVNPQDSVPAGQDAIAVGPATVVNGNNGIGIGNSAVVGPSAVGGIAIGPNTQATGTASTALGAGTQAQGAQSLALGAGAVTRQVNSIALGASSVTTVGAQGSYSAYGLPTTQASVGEVGIGTAQGNRKITGVAAGSAGYDAVNVTQLTAVGNKVDQNTADITSLDGRVTNVEGGMTSITNGGGIKYFHTHSTEPDSVASGSDSVAIGPNAQASGTTSIALGAGSTAQGAQSLALGAGAAASQANSIALGASSVTTVGAESNYSAYGLTASQTSVGEVGVGTAQGNRKITGVAAGSADYDAVNVAQLTAVGDKVDQNTADITSLDGRVTNVEGEMTSITNGGGVKYFHTHSTEPDSVASGSDSVAIGPNAQASGTASVASGKGTLASGNGAVAIGDAASVSAEGSVALGQGSADNGRGAESYTGKYSTTDNTTSGTVSVGNAATGETRTVSNVADGREAMDAVNLRQLDGAMAAVGDTVSGLQNGTDGMFQVNNNSGQAKPSATGTDAMAGGAGSVASGSHSTAMGTGSKATAANSTALGANSVADRENSVSVGSVGNERQLTNIAVGTQGTDAVNLDQLNHSMSNVTNDANAYTDQRYSALKEDLKKQDSTLSAGIAGAMAMASLTQPYTPGASMATIGAASYRGQSALSVGVSSISDSGRWVSKLQASSNTQGDMGVGVGVGYQW
ncbi:coiled stalk of trimeric autotransporter adhesin family protein [Yersinia pseudotuberculosis]|uniref:trimeric autotransporter adhesin YadE n=1 Tax=Yersinia pseudotuberculosis TaxID=633 RepID=UPI0001739930|nr:trimeric autotransporter adhesin YadE [Yersinia pseudotuberculosis]AJJ67306.1 coiled stalk of trimeric autotransporter adhesin family protein [Yersinia pseudotuberculosis PB1/+]CQD49519.1 hemagglutination repeat-containing protein [Yersinia intermedia]AJJ02758.1 coiled stalk of trimeric autotransporter adhesin family protein [Yersinia pseudotuberculosis]AJJ69418.1 coiled stalk of trimeric autotransporter adhesin family protein [Yersinia pseudotuberculosis]MBO1605625.1 cell surface protein [